jgi:hypothetical protein
MGLKLAMEPVLSSRHTPRMPGEMERQSRYDLSSMASENVMETAPSGDAIVPPSPGSEETTSGLSVSALVEKRCSKRRSSDTPLRSIASSDTDTRYSAFERNGAYGKNVRVDPSQEHIPATMAPSSVRENEDSTDDWHGLPENDKLTDIPGVIS